MSVPESTLPPLPSRTGSAHSAVIIILSRIKKKKNMNTAVTETPTPRERVILARR